MYDLDEKSTNLNQAWATEDIIFPIEGGSIQGRIIDQQNCFNLNILDTEPVEDNQLPFSHQVFEEMLQASEVPAATSQKLRERILDWIDSDYNTSGFDGVEYEYQRTDSRRYYVSNQPMADPSEVKLLDTLDTAAWDSIKHLICTIPNEKKFQVNINTLQENQSPCGNFSLPSQQNSQKAV